jgi:hypothetical protein
MDARPFLKNIDRAISLIASLAAALTALFALWTVQEMQQQRRDSFRPEIDITQFNAKFTADAANPFSAKIYVQNGGRLASAPETIDAPESADLELVNVGVGAARNLEVHWFYDRLGVVADVESKFPNTALAVDFSHPWPSLRIGNAYTALRIRPPDTLAYLLPLKDASKPANIPFPDDYMELAGLGLSFAGSDVTMSAYFKALPHLYVRIDYEDMTGNKYEQVYRLDTESWTRLIEPNHIVFFTGKFSVATLPEYLLQQAPESALMALALRYCDSWSSHHAEQIARYFAESGSLIINDEPRAVGRSKITALARTWMATIPDGVLKFDRLVDKGDRKILYWTLVSAKGPDGKPVHIDGTEEWRLTDDGTIAEATRRYDDGGHKKPIGK